MVDRKLLSLGIPTYNRASYLDKCLETILPQISPYLDKINIYISDNASTDNTKDVVEKYLKSGYKLQYFRQEVNLGMDGNFEYLYNISDTKLIWMLSDDEYLLPNSLERIMKLIGEKEFGVIYLNHVWYENNFDLTNIDLTAETKVSEYKDPVQFVDRVNFWFTFLSATIINKDLIKSHIDLSKYEKNFLLLLWWIIPTVFRGKPNIVIENALMACKGNNTGGYRLYKVFGTNFNKVLGEMAKKNLVDKKIIKIINNHLLKSFFPMFINNRNEKFVNENPLKILIPIYWTYPIFWRRIFPVLIKNYLK